MITRNRVCLWYDGAALEAATFRPRAIPPALHQELNRLVEPGAEQE